MGSRPWDAAEQHTLGHPKLNYKGLCQGTIPRKKLDISAHTHHKGMTCRDLANICQKAKASACCRCGLQNLSYTLSGWVANNDCTNTFASMVVSPLGILHSVVSRPLHLGTHALFCMQNDDPNISERRHSVCYVDMRGQKLEYQVARWKLRRMLACAEFVVCCRCCTALSTEV